MEEEPYEILNAIYETESNILNNIETVRCMLRGHINGEVELKSADPDITLRDFFAGCALIASVIESGLWRKDHSGDVDAAWSYTIADAMMKARQTYDKTSDRGIKGEG